MQGRAEKDELADAQTEKKRARQIKATKRDSVALLDRFPRYRLGRTFREGDRRERIVQTAKSR